MKDITAFFESEEGKKSLDEWKKKMVDAEKIESSQYQRFHEKYSHRFEEIVNKVIGKYDSDKYCDMWYRRHIEPPEDLYWFLLGYAEKYGRAATTKDFEKHGNMFTSKMFFINGYYFSRMDGQGSVVKIYK